MRRLLVAGLAGLALVACGRPATEAPEMPPNAEDDVPEARPDVLPPRETAGRAFRLPDLFDCLRKEGGAVIAAHRGGPAPGYPENALETLQQGYEAGLKVFEIDVSESRDGVLFLHHDNRFGRTVAGEGYVSDTDWADIAGMRLKDNSGKLTDFHPPKLTDVFLWAKTRDVILELDRKETTGFRNIIEAVKASGVADRVIMISYSDEEAAAIARLGPDIMLTALARGDRDVAQLEERGVDRTRLIAWLGTREPDPPAFERLNQEGVEVAFGTLGRKGERLDDAYWADGEGSEYQRLVDDGVVLIATDEPYRVASYLTADDEGWAACAAR